MYQSRFVGTEAWFLIAGRTAQECAERTIYLHGLRRARNVREVSPGMWRGIVGRRVSPTVEVRVAYGVSLAPVASD
jgi:hypothetical protein